MSLAWRFVSLVWGCRIYHGVAGAAGREIVKSFLEKSSAFLYIPRIKHFTLMKIRIFLFDNIILFIFVIRQETVAYEDNI